MNAITNDIRVPTMVERIEPLLESIRAAATTVEAERRPAADFMTPIVEAGLVRAMVPRERGGEESDLADWLNAIRRIARADMAAGWVAGLLATHSAVISHFDPRAQDEVWADGPDTIVGSSGAPVGRIERVAGGVLLSGRFPFSSGCDFCTWTMVGFVMPEGDARPAGFYQCLVPRGDYVIEDDWYTSGLRGTGSKSLIFDRAFVPEYRWFGPGMDRGPLVPDRYANPMFDAPFALMYNAPFSAIVLGGAEGALDAAVAALKGRRTSAITDQRTNAYAPRQIFLAEGALQIRGAAAMVEESWRMLQRGVTKAGGPSPEEFLWWRGNEAFAVRQARAGVDRLINDAGGSAHYARNPLQRFWRDVHTACEHPWLDLIGTGEAIGRMMLGIAAEDVKVM